MSHPCKFFNTPQGCRFGDRCAYKHNVVKASAPVQAVVRPPPPQSLRAPRSVEVPRPVQGVTDQRSHTAVSHLDDPPRSAPGWRSVEDLWGFEDTGDDSIESQVLAPSSQWAGARFVDVVKESLTEDEYIHYVHQFYSDEDDRRSAERQADKPLCRFFASGLCKFGDYCRYSHDQSLAVASTNEECCEFTPVSNMGQSGPVECGICLEAPKGSLYGLLSHCDCKFCVDCIREWRKDGVTVAKNNEQVRLCPLCRQQSYYIVPSPVHVTGERKQQVLDEFLVAIACKPCKYYTMGQECPFGSSCFYQHAEDGNKYSTARVIKGADPNSAFAPKAQVSLMDLISASQSR